MIFSFDFLNKNSLNNFQIYAEKVPSIFLPQRNVTFTEVQGRNGSLIQDDKTYKDIVIPVTCWFIDNTNLANKIDNVKAWLAGGEGDLIFSTQPDKKYSARVIDQMDITQEYRILGKFQVNFRCKPFKQAVDNSIATLTTPGSINNSGTFESEPVIKIYGSGNIDLTINNNIIHLTNVVDYITIDSVLQDCYKDTTLCNNQMLGDFPKLQVGNNGISWTGTVTKVEVTPNWRWI